MSEFLLGMDMGTSSCKITLFKKNGMVVGSANREYPVYYPKQGWAEQNPEDWWIAVCKAIKELLDKTGINPNQIAGIGIDGQSWSAVAVDKSGEVLTNTPIWMDTRATDICNRLNMELGEDEIFKVAGNSVQPFYTTPKILWYQKKLPEVYKSTDKILQSNSFIAFRLTGIATQDISQGYGLHCFDIKKGNWDLHMCKKLQIPESFLPEIYASHDVIGGVTKEAAEKTGLCEGIPVVAGGLDAACGTLGAGVIHPGKTQEQGGQAGGMSICMDEYAADPRLIVSRHVVPGLWLLQGGTTGGGGVMRWLEKEFAQYERSLAGVSGKSSLVRFNELAEMINPGSDGLIFLPYMSGERSPIWDPYAKGVFFGLDYSKTKGHMIRSAMEGVAFSLKHNLDIAEAKGAMVKELLATGGSANSVLWTQIKADITGKPIAVPSSDTATTLGAAILAGVGTGLYKDFEEAVKMTVTITRRQEPDKSKYKEYRRNYGIYLELYKNLKNLMNDIGGN